MAPWRSSASRRDSSWSRAQRLRSGDTEVKERHGLVSKLIAWLKRQKLWPWVRLSVELNLSEIKRAFSQEEVSRDEVEAMGLRVIDAHDAVVITPTMKPATSREQAA